MLTGLHVKNFAIIDEIWLDLGEGFNVLTGETGAGKSILIGSINAALGGRVSKDMIGSSSDHALVELTFESNNPELVRVFDENDLLLEDGQVIISRRIQPNGRSVSRINGETVSASILKEIADVLIDIHGQHEHQSLLYKAGQRRIVDKYSEECGRLLKKVEELYAGYKDARDALETARNSDKKSERELELYAFELEEIRNARLKAGEDWELEERFKLLSNTEKIIEEINAALGSLSDGRETAEKGIDEALRSLGRVSQLSEELASLQEELGGISEQLLDVTARLRDYAGGLSGGEEEFAEVSERLDVINRLKSRYRNSIEGIIEYADERERQLEEYSDIDARLEKLEKLAREKEESLKKADEELYCARIAAAELLTGEITAALKELNFEHAGFKIEVSRLDHYTPSGASEIEFFLSANLGEPMRRLSQTASGGELSRVMLAIKSVAAGENDIDSLIFDEIDTGISGRTAQMVAEKIALISADRQVICITHLPQIAAMADRHFLIEKVQDEGRTRTLLKRLDEDQTAGELARMTGGVKVTGSVINSAREMKQLADEEKQKIRNKRK